MHSIEHRLRWRLLFGSLAVSLLMALGVAWLVDRQVRELLDYQLEQVARTLIDRDFEHGGSPPVEDPAMHLDIQVRDASVGTLYRSSDEVELPAGAPSGFSRARSGPQDDAVELHLFTLRKQPRTVQVGQPAELRRELAREAALELLLPALAAMALLSVLILVTVRQALAPLRELSAQLERRNAGSLAPISLPGAPAELQAPLQTLNALLERLSASFAAHRLFIAEAAHELRTPLAAIRLQADNLLQAGDAPARGRAAQQLQRGIERAQHLAAQLLNLARLESAAPPPPEETLDLVRLAGESLVLRAPEAEGRGVELALDAPGAARIAGEAHTARLLLDNLLDNALKHAASGRLVEVGVRCEAQAVSLVVRDHGPGIPEAARERVLERFYRHEPGDTPGSGLGLAIVAQAARRLQARLELRSPARGAGLEVEVLFPAAPRS